MSVNAELFLAGLRVDNLIAEVGPRLEDLVDRLTELERLVASELMAYEDIDELADWLERANELERRLRGRALQRPILGVQRRIEARIGQLLGPPPGRRRLS